MEYVIVIKERNSFEILIVYIGTCAFCEYSSLATNKMDFLYCVQFLSIIDSCIHSTKGREFWVVLLKSILKLNLVP